MRRKDFHAAIEALKKGDFVTFGVQNKHVLWERVGFYMGQHNDTRIGLQDGHRNSYSYKSLVFMEFNGMHFGYDWEACQH